MFGALDLVSLGPDGPTALVNLNRSMTETELFLDRILSTSITNIDSNCAIAPFWHIPAATYC